MGQSLNSSIARNLDTLLVFRQKNVRNILSQFDQMSRIIVKVIFECSAGMVNVTVIQLLAGGFNKTTTFA